MGRRSFDEQGDYPLFILIFLLVVAPASAGLCVSRGIQPAERGQAAVISKQTSVSLSDFIGGHAHAQTAGAVRKWTGSGPVAI